MRKAINDNPMVQVGVLGALALVVGFVLITQMGKGSSSSTSSSSPASSSAASVAPTDSGSAAATTPPDSTATTPSDSTTATPPAPPTSAPDASAGTAVPAAPPAAAAAAGKFVAGPGLPRPVVQAYDADKVVVLLVVRHGGIDDDAVKASVEGMRGAPDVALFTTNAGHVSRYSRIASGVNLDRVPALIVLRPEKLTHGGIPTATVSYGFRRPDSVAQAIADALYKGPTNVPYYPK